MPAQPQSKAPLLAAGIVAIVLVLVSMGAYLMRPIDAFPTPPVENTPPQEQLPTAPENATTTASVNLGQLFTLKLGETVTLNGGGDSGTRTIGSVTLEKINDSRCKPDVVCVWEGELAAQVRYQDGNGVTRTLNLGLQTKPCEEGLTLESITETAVTFMQAIACNE